MNNDDQSTGIVQEELKSEYLRSLLLAIVFTAILLVSFINNTFFIKDSLQQPYGNRNVIYTIMYFIGVFVVYQGCNLLYLKRTLGLSRRLPRWYKVFHTLVEITLPSTVMFYLMTELQRGAVIDSPIAVAYTIFIVLSILHLDPRVNIFAGALVAVQYAALTWYAFEYVTPDDTYTSLFPANAHYVRSVLFLFSGAAAAFVSRELRKRIRSAFDYLQAKTNLEVLFGQQVSREVSQALIENKGATRKVHATVMFLDTRNFTAFADSHSAEEVIDYQNKFVGPVIDIINQHQGVVYQILGDGLMACFGVPVVNVLHADMAFQAAINIIDHVRKASANGTIPPTNIGIGLHCGSMVSGNIGSEFRKQFSISGTPVIVASRIEQLNKKYGTVFLMSKDIYDHISIGKVNIDFIGEEELKGIGKPIGIYSVKC